MDQDADDGETAEAESTSDASDSAAEAESTSDTSDAPAEAESVSDAPGTAAETAPAVDVPPVEELTGGVQRLDARVKVVWILGTGIVALVLGAIAAAASVFADVGFWPGLVVVTAVFGLGVAHAIVRYRIWRYEVRADALYLERGVLTRVKTVVPHVRIQHVDASRGPLERALGLSSVVVYTAGSRGADVTVPGLTPGRADDLQTRLKQLAIAAEGEDAV